MENSDKQEIRKALLTERGQLSKATQQQKSSLIIEKIKESPAFTQARKIAFYHAVRGEADPANLAKIASKNTQFYLPILSTDKNQGLVFAPIDQQTQYKNNQFSIPEPIVEASKMINAEELDLVLMPLLGFDTKGNRLGMGGGYYDRSFSFKKHRIKKPILLGFAYDFQEVESLVSEPWDIGLDMLATESRLINF